MSAPTGTVFQSNFKIGNGLHNIYAESLTDYLDQLDVFSDQVLSKITAIEQTINGALVVAQAMPLAPAATQTAPAATPPAGSESSEGHSCPHGPMKFVPAGVSKSTGKPYRAFYSCQVRGSGCPTVSA